MYLCMSQLITTMYLCIYAIRPNYCYNVFIFMSIHLYSLCRPLVLFIYDHI